MKPGADIRAFMARLGHDFARPELLVRALTHGSIASATRPDNQRLEFLGDRVLGLATADRLYAAFPDADEGDLSRRLAGLVRRETCAAVATAWDVGPHLVLGQGEVLGGGLGEGLLERADEVGVGGLEGVLLGVGGGLDGCQFEEEWLWECVWRSVPGRNARLGTTSGSPSRSSGCRPMSCARSR